mmetsp:Transcript_34263/g.95611  ORF Transcript_34263/g.95611 Transcript_34263/m.95611 type:complete len:382 (-) Transcript_34263:137-1282(-)
MVHVPDHVHLVGELAGHISRLLELNLRGGNAELPQLLLDGYLVPHGEDIRQVLRDDEVLDVEPRECAAGSATTSALALAAVAPQKRPAPAAGVGAAGAKRQRQAPAAAAISWQPPTAAVCESGAAPKVKTARPESSSSSSEESSDEDETEPAAPSTGVARARGRARGGCFGGGRGRMQDDSAPAAVAQATALATCGKGKSGKGGGAQDEGRGIFVGGLPPTVDDAALKRHFQSYGAVEDADVVMNRSTGKSKGFGFVQFADVRSRDKVIADGPTQEIWGRSVEIKPRTPKGGKGHKGKEGAAKGEGKGRGHKGKLGAQQRSDAAEPEPSRPKAAPAALPDLDDEELEMQRQMAALGLPVSFTASAQRAEDSEDDEGEEEEE